MMSTVLGTGITEPRSASPNNEAEVPGGSAEDRERARLLDQVRRLELRLHAAYAARRTMAGQLRDVIRRRASTIREANRQRERADRAEGLLQRRDRLLRSALSALQEQRTEADEARRQFGIRHAALAPASVEEALTGPLLRIRQRLRDAHLPLRWLATRPLRFVRGAVRLRHREFRLGVTELAESGLFDVAHYQAVTGAPPGTNLVARFLLGGDSANESPHPLFDPVRYRTRNAAIPAETPPLRHYLRSDGGELRTPHPLFDPRFYVTQRPGEMLGAATPLTHFLRFGGRAGLSPHPLFDGAYYFQQRQDLAEAGVNPLLHYLATAATELVDPHPLFSTRHYLATHPDIAPQNPLEHFVRQGALEGHSPHPLFDVGYYWKHRPDVRKLGVNPLVHYLEFGTKEIIDPHPLFDAAYYFDQAEALRGLGVNPLLHFLRWGGWDGLRPNPWFDPLWYLTRNPDVRGINPLIHFVERGWREGRDPSPEFSLAQYRATNPDVEAAGVNPLVHYLTLGRSEGRGGAGPGRSVSRAGPLRFTVHGPAPTTRTLMCVGHVSPWPIAAGNQYALSRLLHYFQDRGYRIVLVLAPIPSEPLPPGALDQLETEFGNVVICEPSGKVEFRLRDLPNVLTALAKTPVIEDFSSAPGPDVDFCHDALMAVVTRLLAATGATAVLAEYIFMTRLFTQIGPDTLRIVHTHDVFSQKAANVVAYGIADAQISEEVESRLLNRADVVMAVTPEDAAILEAPRTDHGHRPQQGGRDRASRCGLGDAQGRIPPRVRQPVERHRPPRFPEVRVATSPRARSGRRAARRRRSWTVGTARHGGGSRARARSRPPTGVRRPPAS